MANPILPTSEDAPLFELVANCCVADCDRSVHNKRDQLCDAHYKRKWRYGDPLAGGPMRPWARAGKAPQDFADGTRACNVCGERLSLDLFPRDAGGTNGRRSNCGVCHAAKSRAWHDQNRDAVTARMKQYRVDNAEQVRKQDTERYVRDRDKRIALATQQSHKRRVRMKAGEYDATVTRANLRKQYGDQCFYCQVEMDFRRYTHSTKPDNLATLEHIEPICRGGAHTWTNCVLACWRCNITKNKMDPREWAGLMAAS